MLFVKVMVGVSETESLDLFSPDQLSNGISAHEKNRFARKMLLCKREEKISI